MILYGIIFLIFTISHTPPIIIAETYPIIADKTFPSFIIRKINTKIKKNNGFIIVKILKSLNLSRPLNNEEKIAETVINGMTTDNNTIYKQNIIENNPYNDSEWSQQLDWIASRQDHYSHDIRYQH